jgi:hypothetical protein
MTTADCAAIISDLQTWLTRSKGGHFVAPLPVRKVQAVMDMLLLLKSENDRLTGELVALRLYAAANHGALIEDWDDDEDEDW